MTTAEQDRRREALRVEAATLEADEDDRREMLEIAVIMGLLGAEG